MSDQKITLDGQEIEPAKLEEAKQNPAVRIIETGPGQYKTLEHLKG